MDSNETRIEAVAIHSAKLLIVEDEAVVAMDLEAQLQEMGYQVVGSADNGKKALALARAHRPDLILMDIVIKGEHDGIETAKNIRHALNIPVLFLSAYSDKGTVERAVRAAPYGYLTKPFQTKELRAAIEVALYKAMLERQLRDSEQWLASTLRCLADAVVATDQQGKVRLMNPAAEAMLRGDGSNGSNGECAPGQDAGQLIRLLDPDTGAALESPIHHALRLESSVGIAFGSLLQLRGGGTMPVDDSAAVIRDEDGKIIGAVAVLRDARERLATVEKLKSSEQRFRNAFDFAAVGMALVGLDNCFLEVNSAICTLLDRKESELIGVDQSIFSHPADLEGERRFLLEILGGHATSVQFEKRYRTKGETLVWTLVSASLLRQNNEPLCYLFQIHNVTERKQAEYRLARLAHYDVLTGLANRAFLSEEIERQIVLARRHKHKLAVVFLDLDHFKQINDSLGHVAGDQLLQAMAAKLKASVRESDTVARLGGDEFVLLLPDIRSASEVLVVTDKVQIECGAPVSVAGVEISIGISLGVSLFPDDAQNSSTLLKYADSALYHAKSEGRNNLQFYRPELTAHMEQRMVLGAGLRSAAARGEFELFYQPIMSLSANTPQAAEALIRWHHPSLGLLGPDLFLPIAEETGLSISIGEWVISSACHEAATWTGAGTNLVVAVNVSAQQFKSGDGKLVETVRQALHRSGLSPARLCLEITEQLMLKDSEKNLVMIAELKALGVKIAIDDFGVGYSSLSAIRRFGPSELKLDCSLVRHVASDPDDAAIARAAIAMAHTLKLNVVAEGVETDAQRVFLQGEGCDMTQGFFYCQPHPVGEFRQWLEQQGVG